MDTGFPMRQVTWPQAVLALGVTALFFGTVLALTKMGVDAAQVMTTCVLLLLSVLGVLGWKNQDQMKEKIEEVKQLSNGRLDTLAEENKRLQNQVTALALQMQPPDAK
jgi:hypothetical protein